MSADSYIPGISAYPDMARQFEVKMQRISISSCTDCDRNKLIAQFRERLRRSLERDKHTRRT